MPTAPGTGCVPGRDEIDEVLRLVSVEAAAYLSELDERSVRSSGVEEAAERFERPLPETGVGAAAALRTLIDEGMDAAVSTSGPRCFHFVIGGSTPAALGADWVASLLDQVAYAWVSSPLGVALELVSLGWLKDLFGLPTAWSGVMTSGATMANFACLAAARQWWGDQLGVDAAEEGLAGLPKPRVFSSGYIHASAVKCLAMLGIGRSSLTTFSRDAAGRLDVGALEGALRTNNGAPAIVIANAGEVNAGGFDPITTMADLAKAYGAWLHVDGAFGLFARLSPQTASLAAGVERADSVTVDGHKWLNVPYDAGFAFVRDHALLVRAFAYTAAYLPAVDDPHPNLGTVGPESSRRARALAVWATLQAYGRQGYRALVEGHLALARRMRGRGAGPGAPGERSLEHRLFPVQSGWPQRDRARPTQHTTGRSHSAGRTGLRRHNAVRRPRRTSAGHRELAHPRRGRRSVRGGGPGAGRAAQDRFSQLTPPR